MKLFKLHINTEYVLLVFYIAGLFFSVIPLFLALLYDLLSEYARIYSSITFPMYPLATPFFMWVNFSISCTCFFVCLCINAFLHINKKRAPRD